LEELIEVFSGVGSGNSDSNLEVDFGSGSFIEESWPELDGLAEIER
jgi:hypothetical protein